VRPIKQEARSYFGRGIYTVAEAARLLHLPPRKARRWAAGYDFTSHGAPRFSEPLIHREFQTAAGFVELSFLDVIEMLFIKAFHERGVSLQVIRLTAENATQMLGVDHPFSNQRFRTDGSTIFARLSKDLDLARVPLTSADAKLIDLRTGQHQFDLIISPFLQRFEYDLKTDLVRQWWPFGKTRGVVLDPTINFGEPIVPRFGIPTRILKLAVSSGRSFERVADWYQVPVQAIRDAVAFEDSLTRVA
jgi:uncharacterized protein (DUF433 family)